MCFCGVPDALWGTADPQRPRLGSGQPLPAPHRRKKQAAVKMATTPTRPVAALSERPVGEHSTAGSALVHHRTTQTCHSEERSDVGISGRQLRFRRWLSHDPAGYCEIATSAYGLLAMTSRGPAVFYRQPVRIVSLSPGGESPAPTINVCGRRWLVRPASAFPRLPRRPTASSQ